MRAPMLGLALGLLATAAVAEERLAGSWTATDAERNGAPANDLVGHRLTFAGERFEIVGADGRLVYAGTTRIDPAVEPPAIDFVNTEGEAKGVTWQGIWRLDDPALVITDNAPDPSRPRPTDFVAPAGSGYVKVIFAPDR
jgi:uncharacterized protein (TIGR03067 family)